MAAIDDLNDDDALVARWMGDGDGNGTADYTDSSGNGATLTATGSVTTSADDLPEGYQDEGLGFAFDFTGANSGPYLSRAFSPLTLTITTGTMCGWMLMRSQSSGGSTNSRAIMVQGGSTVFCGFFTYASSAASAGLLRWAWNGPGINSLARCDDSVWRFIAATRNGTSGVSSLYIDGVLQGTSSTSPGAASSAVFFLGGQSQNTYRRFNGRLYDMRIYNRVLTETELATLQTGYVASDLAPRLAAGRLAQPRLALPRLALTRFN